MSIHATAIVDPNAQIADDAEIGPFTIIGPHVRIGARTIIGPHCVIDGRTDIGEDNRFFSGAQIGIVSQDMKHDWGELGRCIIGSHNLIREHVTISASTVSGPDEGERSTSVGDHCLFMAYTHIGHDSHVGSHVWMSNCTALAGHIVVQDHAILSGLVGVHQECTVGRHSFIGGLSRINQDAPPFMIVEGNPARVHGPNAVGLRRKGFDEAARGRIKLMYKIMYRSDLNTSQALLEIEKQVDDSPERTEFVEFYRRSIRGVTR